MKWRELKRNAVLKQEEILKAAKTGKRELTPEEQAEFDALQRKIDVYQTHIDDGEDEDGTGKRDFHPAPSVPMPGTDGQQTAERAIEQERQRIAEITNLCREFNLDAQEYIEKGTTVAEVKDAVIEQQRQHGAPVGARGMSGISVGADEGDKFRAAAADGLILRSGIELDNPSSGARDFRNMSLRDLAIEALQRDGHTENLLRMSADDLYQLAVRDFFNPSAAFPAIMDTAIKKSYVEGYNKVAVTFDRWTSKGTLKDFKQTSDHEYLAGAAGEFLEVPENGELKSDTHTDILLPNRQLKTYGRQFRMSRQAFINDDIGFVTLIPSKYAASAKKTINKQVYGILLNNKPIFDGTALFHKTHGNLIATGTGITSQSIQKIIMAMQKQKDQFGEAIIIRPAYLLVPVGYGFTIQTILGSPTIQTTENTQAVNPLYHYPIEVIEEPTINAMVGEGKAMPWFLIADKNDAKSIQVDYLNGQEIPTIRRMEIAGQLGFVWDIYLDWGVTAADYRGIQMNPGVVMED